MPLAKEIEMAVEAQGKSFEIIFMNKIIKAGIENSETTYEYNGNTYIMSVKKL